MVGGMSSNKIFVVIPAAGTGSRMESSLPKQYLELESNQTVLSKSLEIIFRNVEVERAVIAVAKGDFRFHKSISLFEQRCHIVEGGEQRIDSVSNCLDLLVGEASDDDWILVHDAARPCVRGEDVSNLISCVEHTSVGGILGVPVTDTLKLLDGDNVVKTVDRKNIWRALTPQIFRFKILRDALKLASKKGQIFTDEAQAVERAGHPVKIILGHEDNIKITYPDDLKLAQYFLTVQDAL